jgi:transposase
MRYELTDGEWTAIKPMLPNKPRGVPMSPRPSPRGDRARENLPSVLRDGFRSLVLLSKTSSRRA